MVLTDSHGISRAPYYLGYSHRRHKHITVTGLTPSLAGLSKPFTYARTSHPTSPAELVWKVPQPRPCNARRLSHVERFSLIRVRSPLLTESLLFSLPAGTEMFHFPAFPHAPYVFRYGSPSHSRAQRGFPIRTPWDHSPVIDSPRLIADSYVLLRLLMPRHPPCALKNLTTKIKNYFTREPRKPTTTPDTPQRDANSHGQIQVHILGNCFLYKMLASTM